MPNSRVTLTYYDNAAKILRDHIVDVEGLANTVVTNVYYGSALAQHFTQPTKPHNVKPGDTWLQLDPQGNPAGLYEYDAGYTWNPITKAFPHSGQQLVTAPPHYTTHRQCYLPAELVGGIAASPGPTYLAYIPNTCPHCGSVVLMLTFGSPNDHALVDQPCVCLSTWESFIRVCPVVTAKDAANIVSTEVSFWAWEAERNYGSYISNRTGLTDKHFPLYYMNKNVAQPTVQPAQQQSSAAPYRPTPAVPTPTPQAKKADPRGTPSYGANCSKCGNYNEYAEVYPGENHTCWACKNGY